MVMNHETLFQVFDELPEKLFGDHDLPCDVIVTPTEVIRVSEPSPKPERIIWSLITREKFDNIPVLREIQYKEKRAGNDVRLKVSIECRKYLFLIMFSMLS